MTMATVLTVQGLIKNYGSFRAVDGISFSVPRGQAIGLLGPNGAGKTTTIQVLLGITKVNGGTIHYFGQNFQHHRQACLQRINFSSSFNTLQGRITVWENLLVYAQLYRVQHSKQKIMELVDYFQINNLLHERLWDVSAGQKTRVNLIKALLNDPELILLDEPTASLDPDIADKLLSLIEQLKRDRQLSLLYTSHDMAEVTRICDEVIFLDHGKIVAQDTPLGLTKRITHSQLQLSFDGDQTKLQQVLKPYQVRYTFPTSFSIRINLPEQLIPKVIFNLSQAGVWITDIEITKPTLEDVFLQIARGQHDIT
ncbi:MAG: ABC transporter ATP-binding protein [Candidatus Kerfeldbacteria bacterium]|nr:ABC transporter ATP-binding protein [Candidatus Kerfeldbacteria bacterium]